MPWNLSTSSRTGAEVSLATQLLAPRGHVSTTMCTCWTPIFVVSSTVYGSRIVLRTTLWQMLRLRLRLFPKVCLVHTNTVEAIALRRHAPMQQRKSVAHYHIGVAGTSYQRTPYHASIQLGGKLEVWCANDCKTAVGCELTRCLFA